MKKQILTALLVLTMMMGTGTVMAEDSTTLGDGDYLGEDFGWGPATQLKGYYEYVPFHIRGDDPNGFDFGCRNK